jgi:hypothetical protein
MNNRFFSEGIFLRGDMNFNQDTFRIATRAACVSFSLTLGLLIIIDPKNTMGIGALLAWGIGSGLGSFLLNFYLRKLWKRKGMRDV